MLRARLKNAQVKTSEAKYFLPNEKLYRILTDDMVRDCISKAQIDASWKQHCIQAVLDGGRALLALLILIDRTELLVSFLETSQSPFSTLDSKLPFTQAALERAIKDDKDARIDLYRR